MPIRHRVSFDKKCPTDLHAKLRDPRCRDDVDEKHKKPKPGGGGGGGGGGKPGGGKGGGGGIPVDPPVDPDVPDIPVIPDFPGRRLWSFDPLAAGIGGGVGAMTGFTADRIYRGAWLGRASGGAKINPVGQSEESVEPETPEINFTNNEINQAEIDPFENELDSLEMSDLPAPMAPEMAGIRRALSSRVDGQSELAQLENSATSGEMRSTSLDGDFFKGLEQDMGGGDTSAGGGIAMRLGLRQSRILRVDGQSDLAELENPATSGELRTTSLDGDFFRSAARDAEGDAIDNGAGVMARSAMRAARIDGQSALAESENAATRGALRTTNLDDVIDSDPVMDAPPEMSFMGDGSDPAAAGLGRIANIAKMIKARFKPNTQGEEGETQELLAETSDQDAVAGARTALDNAEQSQSDITTEVSGDNAAVTSDTAAVTSDTTAEAAAEAAPVVEPDVPDLIDFNPSQAAVEGADVNVASAEGIDAASGGVDAALTAAQLSQVNATAAAADSGEGALDGGTIGDAAAAVSNTATSAVGELATAEAAAAPLDFATLGMSALVAGIGVGISQFVSWLVGDVQHNQATYAATQPMTDGDIANIQSNLASVVTQTGMTESEDSGILQTGVNAQKEMDELQNTSAEGTWVNTGAGFNQNQKVAMGELLAFKAGGSNSTTGMWAGFNQVEGSGGEWGNDQSINFGLASGSNGSTAQQAAGLAAWKKAVKDAPATAIAANRLMAQVKAAHTAGLPVWNVNLGPKKGSQIVIQLSQTQLAQAAAQAAINPNAFKGQNPAVLNAMGLNGAVLSVGGTGVQSTGTWVMDGSNGGQGQFITTPTNKVTISNKTMFSPWLMNNPTDIPTPAQIQAAVTNQKQTAQNNYMLQAQSQIAGQTGAVASYLTYELNLWKYNNGLLAAKPAFMAKPSGAANAAAISSAQATLTTAQATLAAAQAAATAANTTLTTAQGLTTTDQSTLTQDQTNLTTAQANLAASQAQYNTTLSGSIQQSYDKQYAALTEEARAGNFVPNYNDLLNPKQLYLSAGGTGTAPTNILNNTNSATTGVSFNNGSPVISQALNAAIHPTRPTAPVATLGVFHQDANGNVASNNTTPIPQTDKNGNVA